MPYLLLLLVALFFAGNFIVSRGIQDLVPPLSLSFWRWALAFVFLLPFAIRPFLRQQDLIRTNWKIIGALGFLGVTCFSTFVYIALYSTTVTNAVLINATNPVLIVVFSWIGFRERPSPLQMLGIALSFFGILWIISRENPASLLALHFSGGDLWILAAAAAWALYTILLRFYPAGLSQAAFLMAIFMAGLVFLIPLYLWEIQARAPMILNRASVGGMLYLGIFPSILAYVFWNKAVGAVGANTAGVFNYLIPVFGILLAFIFFNERLQPYHVPGILLISFGIFLTTYFGRKTRPGKV